MQRILSRSLTAALLSLAASAAMAQGAAPATDAARAAPAVDIAAAAAASGDDRLDDRYCLRATGSRIVERSNARGVRRCTAASGRVYSRDDLDGTGAVDIADALRRLDTSIH